MNLPNVQLSAQQSGDWPDSSLSPPSLERGLHLVVSAFGPALPDLFKSLGAGVLFHAPFALKFLISQVLHAS